MIDQQYTQIDTVNDLKSPEFPTTTTVGQTTSLVLVGALIALFVNGNRFRLNPSLVFASRCVVPLFIGITGPGGPNNDPTQQATVRRRQQQQGSRDYRFLAFNIVGCVRANFLK
jgi:hypothetical protein